MVFWDGLGGAFAGGCIVKGVRFSSSGAVFLWVGACGVVVGGRVALWLGIWVLVDLVPGAWGPWVRVCGAACRLVVGSGGVLGLGLAWPRLAGVRVWCGCVGGECSLAFWILFYVCLYVDCMFSRWFVLYAVFGIIGLFCVPWFLFLLSCVGVWARPAAEVPWI